YRLTQGRPRHTKALGQHPLSGQALSGLQGAFKDHGFQLRDDIVRQAALANLTYFHTPLSIGFTTPRTPLRQAYRPARSQTSRTHSTKVVERLFDRHTGDSYPDPTLL